jgi:ERCC4-related helicase
MNPSVGMLATVRNRRAIISSVEAFDGEEGRLHLVDVEYTDGDGGLEDRLIWEREPQAVLVPPAALPRVSDDPPLTHLDFDALVRATRWSALTPFLDPVDENSPLDEPALVSPFHGAVEVDDFQLVPVLKALRMPRVSLLLADDVGLGKTVEAGLVLTELLLRRRIRRVLILCPASLRSQWHEEMQQKFSLEFDHVDRDATHKLRRSMGMDANPWRTYSRIVASYYYLRQPDVLEEFLAFSRNSGNDAQLPWDLLIVDEAHNLSPAPFGEDSDLSRMLEEIAPYFEHKLFLTATPHNGHTRSFTGLLERLDPMRFTQSSELKGAGRARVEDVLVRRLKREINAVTQPPRFADRHIEPIKLELASAEQALSAAFFEFRSRVRSVIAERGREEQLAGAFAVEILGKRLLSCPAAFADSWNRYLEGAREQAEATTSEVRSAERATREEIEDDLESEVRSAHASHVVGAWLKPLSEALASETAGIDAVLEKLALARSGDDGDAVAAIKPSVDSRLDAFFALIEERLRRDGAWRDDERLVVFPEYKTTLDYLQRTLAERYPDAEEGAVRMLYGGMHQDERDVIKAAFNRADDPVRILLATDAAAEGLNLQETARYLLHYDIPWNPSRLEQRNGRLDRHGQARDVSVFHFASDDDDDLRFLSRVVEKVETIREDLGSVSEVLDTGLRRRLIQGAPAENTWGELDQAVDQARKKVQLPRDAQASTDDPSKGVKDEPRHPSATRLEQFRAELDLDADSLRDTLEAALALNAGRPRLEPLDDRGRMRLVQPVPSAWRHLVDDALRLESSGKAPGALPALVFDPGYFVRETNGRPVFRHEPDTALMHLGHPLYHRVLSVFARRRFPTGDDDQATRWTVRRGGVPDGADALVLLTVEELAVNELREGFHHWVRTWQLPVSGETLGSPLSHAAAMSLRLPAQKVIEEDVVRQARDLWDEIEPEIKGFLDSRTEALTSQLAQMLEQAGAQAKKQEQERFRSRQGEINALMAEQSAARLQRELEQIDEELRQQRLFDQAERTQELLRSREGLEEELRRRQTHLKELSEQLGRERRRVLESLLPRRYKLRDAARCFPVAVEIRLPESAA